MTNTPHDEDFQDTSKPANILPNELALAKKIGTSHASKWSSVAVEDCVGHLNLFLVKKYRSGVLTRYRATSGGIYALAELLRREAYSFCIKQEKQAHGGSLPFEDDSKYSYSTIKAILPYIFNGTTIPQTTYNEEDPQSPSYLSSRVYSDALTLVAEAQKAFLLLGKTDQEIITLKYEADLTSKEIATILGITDVAAMTRLNRAIGRLHKEI